MLKILKLLRSKKYFKPPIKKKYLISDSTQSHIFEKYLNPQEVNVMDTRYESINLFILFKTILKFKFSFKNYIIEYIRSTGCEFIISFIDNDLFFYELKKYFPNKTVIIIQNGMRPEFFFKKLSEEKNLKVDYLLTFSDFYSNKFRRFVNGNLISIGSFKNNLIIKKNSKKNKSVAFISSGPSSGDNMKIFEKISLNMDDYFLPEKNLLPLISNYCEENELKLKILARSKSKKTFLFEKEFYKKILKDREFEFLDTFEFGKCYRLSDISKLTVSIYSAFGLECLARGNRTVIFNVRDKATKIESLKLFWSDNKISAKGPFWSDEIVKEEVNRTLNFSIKCSEIEWEESLKTIKHFLIVHDNNNQFFKNLLIKK